MDQGYITLAVGPPRYRDMAVNLALSLKQKDPHRPISLVHDGQSDLSEAAPFFDQLIELPADPAYPGVANKLRVYEASPYAETMFLDGDCLVVKSDMDRHWERFGGDDFNMAGDVRRTGRWYGFDIADTCQTLDLPYLCVMNSGVFFFRKSERAAAVVTTANDLFQAPSSSIRVNHRNQDSQVADEPFYGAAMARHGITPVRYTPEEGSVMVTSWNTRAYDADPSKDHSHVIKARSNHWLLRHLPLDGVRHSPTVMHFIGLRPKPTYDRLTNGLRREFGLPEQVL